MKLLLDTCAFLWLATDAPELSERAKTLFQDTRNPVYLSSVSKRTVHGNGRSRDL